MAPNDLDLRMQSPRPETPEPSSKQGRRNAQFDAQLLDADGAISDKLERCLRHIFAKYCTPCPARPPKHDSTILLTPPGDAILDAAGLDAWAQDTNGAPFSEETKEELREFLDVTEEGELTFKGFAQIYQLQTENDEEETWRDLTQLYVLSQTTDLIVLSLLFQRVGKKKLRAVIRFPLCHDDTTKTRAVSCIVNVLTTDQS